MAGRKPYSHSRSTSETDCPTDPSTLPTQKVGRPHTERKELADLVGVPLPDAIRMSAGRTYGGELQLGLSADIASLIDATNASSALGDDDALDSLKRHTELTDVSSEVTRMAGELRSQGDADRAKAVTRFGTQFAKYVEIIDGELTEEVLDYLEGKLPRFFCRDTCWGQSEPSRLRRAPRTAAESFGARRWRSCGRDAQACPGRRRG